MDLVIRSQYRFQYIPGHPCSTAILVQSFVAHRAPIQIYIEIDLGFEQDGPQGSKGGSPNIPSILHLWSRLIT